MSVLCRTLGVSVAGFYSWRHAQVNPCRRHVADVELVERIREIHQLSRRCVLGAAAGVRQLKLGEGRRVGRKRIERLMRLNGIVGIHKRRRGCTRRDPDATPSDDLVNRQFTPEGPDRLWVADVTEHPTGDGKVYLAVVVDAWSRRVVGWSIADHIRAELVVDALQMADLAAPPTRRPGRSTTPITARQCAAAGVRATAPRRRRARARWAPSATPTTTRWPSRSSRSCSASCSTTRR